MSAVRTDVPPAWEHGCGCGGPLAAALAIGAAIDGPDHHGSAHGQGHAHRRDRRQASGQVTVLTGATVLPVDDSFSEAEAVAVSDGRIVAVGSEAAVRAAAGPDARRVDRPGATILPGFIEPHAHLLPSALFGPWADVGPFRFPTVDGALGHLAALAAARPDGGDDWVLARQFDPSLQEGPDELTTAELDRISTTRPVVVLNASLHFAYVNQVALDRAGITATTPDLAGSPYGRHPDGRPNGVLLGQPAMISVLAHRPGMGDVDLVAAALAVVRRANSVGITTICDQGTGGVLGGGDLDVYAALAASGALTTRLRHSLFDLRSDDWDARGVAPGDGDALVRATGWKIVSDGSNQGRSGRQRDPYLPRPGWPEDHRGVAYVEPDDLAAKVARRAAEGWQVVVHANGDAAIDAALDAFAAVDGGPAAAAHRRHRIEHCSILHDEQVERLAALGVSPSFLIGHVGWWGRAFRDDLLGPERADLLDRAGACDRAGIRWTMHSDELVTPMGPLRCIGQAVTRRLSAEPGTVLAPDERVTVEAAIRAMTADAAWQCHSDHEVGTLEAGKRADLVVLAEDPRAVDPEAIADIAVLETWFDGEPVFSAV
ncbi:MAG: amidohydrolase [Acidimicrobiales bacterium]|nr:amidohydrolase [Acidimicrobiales bacterium]